MRAGTLSIAVGLVALGLTPLVCGGGTTFPELLAQAKASSDQGNVDAALGYYREACQAAETPERREDAVAARNGMLLREKKYAEAREFLQEALADPALPAPIRRRTLITLAGQIMWGSPDEAKQYHDQALTIPTTAVEEQVRTSIVMGHVYAIRKQPENALEAWLPIMDLREAHPANHSLYAHQIGLIYRQMRDEANALRYFQLAVEYGKKVKYSFDYSAAEKAIRELGTPGLPR
jgi:tetratricopeptide (TPR) repeat protein